MFRAALMGLALVACAAMPPAAIAADWKPPSTQAAPEWRGDVLPMGTLVCAEQASIQIITARYRAPVLARVPPVPPDCVSTVTNAQVAIVRRVNASEVLIRFLNGRLRDREMWTEAHLPPRRRP